MPSDAGQAFGKIMPGKPLTRATIKAAISVGVPYGRPHLMLWMPNPPGLG